MNIGESIRRGVKWLFVGHAGGQILQFVFGIALARLLVPADFGMIVTIQVFTGFVGMLATGGMGQSLIRAKTASTNDFEVVFTLQLVIGVLIYSGFFLCAPLIADFFENELYAELLRVSALGFMLKPFTLIRVSWLTREMEFKRRSLIDLAAVTVTGVASVGMALGGLGVWSLVLAGLIGGISGNVLFYLLTPLRFGLRWDAAIIRKHSGYGIKIVANDFLGNVKERSINLILSKMEGAAFLGLFNKAESLARLPNRLITPPTGQTVFRAMSKVQENLDQSKYMFYRTISLLMVYIFPFLIGLWWIAEPFIEVIYGSKWVPAAEPMKVLIIAAFLRPIRATCGALLAAQNRLTQEIIAQIWSLLITVSSCLVGLRWGLIGVAWALVAGGIFYTFYLYILVYRTLRTRLSDLIYAVTPAVLLSTPLCAALAMAHYLAADLRGSMPAFYLVIMVMVGGVVYGSAFLFLPIPALRTESTRWWHQIKSGLQLVSRGLA